jgi:hypothetical protein
MPSLLLLPFLLLMNGCRTAPELDNQQKASEKQRYFAASEKWRRADITSYRMKVSFSTFGPNSGLWDINVVEGSLENWEFKGERNREAWKGFAETLMMSHLFKIARQSLDNPEGSPYSFTVVYDNKLGYVKTFKRVVNPRSSKKPPTDTGFLIEITDFEPE